MNEDPIFMLVLPLVAASILGLVAKRLGLSLVSGYVLGGFVVGPVLRLVTPDSPILSFLGELGIILITFEIGLAVKMDSVGRGRARSGGIVAVEILLVSSISLFLGGLLELPWGDTLVLIFMALNTSTAVVFKTLEERRVQDPQVKATVLGVGAFEDVVAILGLSLFPVLAAFGRNSLPHLIQLGAGITISVTLMIYVGLRVLSGLLSWVARREGEIFMAFSLSVVLTYAYLGLTAGLSTAFGAFIAGLVVSNLRVSDSVSEKLHGLRDLGTLIFFASIGASLPIVEDPVLLTLSIAGALLIILVKFLGFSLSSWVMGVRLEEAFRYGSYMVALSEFGVILARSAAQQGLASSNLYLVSVIAMAASTILSGALVSREETLPGRLASLFPSHLRARLEGVFGIIARALSRDAAAFEEIQGAFWELVRRVAAILFAVGLANVALTYLTPLIMDPLRLPVELGVAGFTILLVLFVLLRMRRVYQRMARGIVRNIEKPQRGLSDVLVSFLYAVTVMTLLFTTFTISYPLIHRSFDYMLGSLGSALVAVAVLVLLLFLTWRRVIGAALRLEETFRLS